MLVLFYGDRNFFNALLKQKSVMTGLFNWKVCSVIFFFLFFFICFEPYQDVTKNQKRLLVLCTANVF